MNEVEAYALALRKRRLSKQLQQLSFSLSKIESRYDIELLDKDHLLALCSGYDAMFNESIELLNELQNETSKGKK